MKRIEAWFQEEQIYHMQRTEAWFQGEHDLSYAEDKSMVLGGA